MLPIGQMLLIGKMLPIGQMLLLRGMLLILPAPAVGAAPHDTVKRSIFHQVLAQIWYALTQICVFREFLRMKGNTQKI
jgi:hypothetical protein